MKFNFESIRMKDTADSFAEIGDYIIKACDVDSEGNIENIDIIYKGQLIFCVNTRNDNALLVLFALALRKENELTNIQETL